MKDSIITPELRSWIGRKTPIWPLEVMTAGDVRRYVDATGDANPLWLSDDFARGAIRGDGHHLVRAVLELVRTQEGGLAGVVHVVAGGGKDAPEAVLPEEVGGGPAHRV